MTGQNVLVVEDDAKISIALKARLNHAGFNVAVANDAVTAVSVARQCQPHVAVLDINMPGGDGFEVARRIDRIMGEGSVPKVFITASKDPAVRAKAEGVEASVFIEKPFTADQLLAAIEEVLSDEPPDLFE